MQIIMKERNLSIELLKFIAVVLVMNSHMEMLYGKYSFMATGGAIGDCLFFFASGFTIFLGRGGRFDNWYKRRIQRIYPSLIGWAVLLSFVVGKSMTVRDLSVGGGNWFISCIMIYYVVLYFVKRYFDTRPMIPFFLSIAIVLVWYMFEDKSSSFMYAETYFKWGHYFLFMLLGAYVGNGGFRLVSNAMIDSCMLVLSVVCFYGLLILASKYLLFSYLQVLSLIPLMGVVIYTYKLCNSPKVDELMRTRLGLCLRFVSGLCLEAYIVQGVLFTDKMNFLFPLNLLLMFFIVIAVAYVTRSLGRVILQLFQKEDFDWKAVVRNM